MTAGGRDKTVSTRVTKSKSRAEPAQSSEVSGSSRGLEQDPSNEYVFSRRTSVERWSQRAPDKIIGDTIIAQEHMRDS